MTSKDSMTREETLAQELAETLGDQKSLAYYRNLASRHSEKFLLQILDRVMKVPQDRIKVSRAALFTWLIQHEGNKDR